MYKIRDYPYVTLRTAQFFPGSACRLESTGEAFRPAVKAALSSDNRTIAIFSTESAANPIDLDDLDPIGVLALVRATSDPNHFEADVMERVRLRDISRHPHPIAQVELLDPPREMGTEEESDLDEHLRALSYEIFERGGSTGERAAGFMDLFEDEQKLQVVYFLATVLPLSPAEGQAILQAATLLLAQEAVLAAGERMLKGKSRRLELREVLWSQTEAREEDDEGTRDSARRLRELVEELKLAPAILERVLPELEKLDRFDPELFEHQDTAGRLEGLLSYPWHIFGDKGTDLDSVEFALDEAVLGHDQAKGAILDILAVHQLDPQAPLPMICLAGPSGVGKRTLAKALARATGRALEIVALAGPDTTLGAGPSQNRGAFDVRREAEQLRGQSRSLPGSAPGAIYEAAMRCGAIDPVLLLESAGPVDAGVARALQELANPQTSDRFQEAYLGLPIDASRMLKVLVVEDLSWLPGSLRDSVVEIEMEGFTQGEKRRLVHESLWPASLRRSGLSARQAKLQTATTNWLVEQSDDSLGVVELSKALDRLARRLARLKVTGKDHPVSLSLSLARDWLGATPNHKAA